MSADNEHTDTTGGSSPATVEFGASPLPAKHQHRAAKVGRFELAFLFLCISAAAVVGGLMFTRRNEVKESSPPVSSLPTEGEDEGVGGKCFETRDELLVAVDDYLGDNRANVMQVYGPIANWCVGQLTDFTAIFRDRKDFNEKLDGWDLSQATTLREMFSGCTSFSQDLDWDVSNVEVSSASSWCLCQVLARVSLLLLTTVSTTTKIMYATGYEFHVLRCLFF